MLLTQADFLMRLLGTVQLLSHARPAATVLRVHKAPLLLAITAVSVAVGAGIGSAQSNALTGSVWVLTTLQGGAPLHGTELTAEFTPQGSVSGSAGCNRYGGKYTTSAAKLRISSLVSTQMACAPAIMAQETGYLKALASARLFTVSGATLTLRNAVGRALLTYRAQSQKLAGTSWRVTGYNNGKQGVESVNAEPKLTATFGKDGNLTGFAGCNSYTARYKATAPKLSIAPVASTRMFCATPKGVMEQENAYLAALHTTATYRIEGSRLELRTATGAVAAELQRT